MITKVVSLNIWHGNVFDSAIEFLNKEDPDVILLQEVYDGKDENLPRVFRTFSVLKQELPSYNAVFGAGFCDITPLGEIESGNAIFSKFKILETENIFFDEPYRTFDAESQTDFSHNPQTILLSKLENNGIEINVGSVHGIWGFDGRDNPRRLEMATTIVKSVKGKKNVVVAGDFNVNPDTQTSRIIEKELVSVFGTTLTKTFSLKHKPEEFKSVVVDLMFVSQNINVVEKDCPDIDVSDHLPLISTLEV